VSDIASPDDTPDMAAAELALGLIEGDERSLALRRVLAEPGFAQDVERWRTRLAQLFDLWPAIEAPAGVLSRVERSIDMPVAATAAPAPAPARRAVFWPAAAGISSVAAAALLIFVLLRPIPTMPGPAQPGRPAARVAAAPTTMLVAAIDPIAAGTPVTAVYDRRSGDLRLTLAALADANRSAELWVIAGDGVPHSLGLLRTSAGSFFTVNADNRTRLAVGAVLAVSLEPIGGSPTGLPTGPIVAKGILAPV
jgi:anti-sigma-K factor RskA